MNEAINNDRQADKRTRAKRADLEAMQERFDAIVTIIKSSVDDTDALVLIRSIAEGRNLDTIIVEAGRKALGLE